MIASSNGLKSEDNDKEEITEKHEDVVEESPEPQAPPTEEKPQYTQRIPYRPKRVYIDQAKLEQEK